MNQTNKTTTNQEAVEEKYKLQKQKLEIEYKEKLLTCEKENLGNQEARDKIHKWYADELQSIDDKKTVEIAGENTAEEIKTLGEKINESIIDPIKDFAEKNLQDLTASKEDKKWNSEARDVKYMEDVKKQTDLKEAEKQIKSQ